MEAARWRHLADRLGCPRLAARFDHLDRAYTERHRHYHTDVHIAECLEHFDEMRELCERPDEVEYAIWLHDVVYHPRKRDNEEKSAQLAAAWLVECDLGRDVVERVTALILATRHDGEPATGDEAVLIDVDLAILGAPPTRFDAYETQVREEYRWVPGPLFRRGRAEVLSGFLERPQLYHTAWMRERREETARANLSRSLEALEG